MGSQTSGKWRLSQVSFLMGTWVHHPLAVIHACLLTLPLLSQLVSHSLHKMGDQMRERQTGAWPVPGTRQLLASWPANKIGGCWKWLWLSASKTLLWNSPRTFDFVRVPNSSVSLMSLINPGAHSQVGWLGFSSHLVSLIKGNSFLEFSSSKRG